MATAREEGGSRGVCVWGVGGWGGGGEGEGYKSAEVYGVVRRLSSLA